jgi:hypothetical protein
MVANYFSQCLVQQMSRRVVSTNLPASSRINLKSGAVTNGQGAFGNTAEVDDCVTGALLHIEPPLAAAPLVLIIPGVGNLSTNFCIKRGFFENDGNVFAGRSRLELHHLDRRYRARGIRIHRSRSRRTRVSNGLNAALK